MARLFCSRAKFKRQKVLRAQRVLHNKSRESLDIYTNYAFWSHDGPNWAPMMLQIVWNLPWNKIDFFFMNKEIQAKNHILWNILINSSYHQKMIYFEFKLEKNGVKCQFWVEIFQIQPISTKFDVQNTYNQQNLMLEIRFLNWLIFKIVNRK